MRIRIPHRRCFVLIAVLMVIVSSLLVATSLLFVAQTEVASAAGARDAAQSRALAWSGLQIVMSRLNDQRDRILSGEGPQIENRYVVYESGNRQGVVQLLPANGHDDGPLLAAEAGKIDLNFTTAEALAVTGVINADEAQAIIASRDGADGKQIWSVADLLRIPGAGITAERLFGEVDELQQAGERDVTQPSQSESHYRGLADALTVHSREPVLQQSGEPRINIAVPWSEELGKRVEARFNRDAAELLKRMLEGGLKFDSDAKIVNTLGAMKVPPEDWPPILDAFTTTDRTVRTGRLDINTATAEALRSLLDVSAEQAAQMVRVRAELSADERATVAWPVLAQILSPEQFERVMDRITNRCWVYRIRLAAGEMMGEESAEWIGHPLMFEAVIDCSTSPPRVAYLRDITVLAETVAIAGQARAQEHQAGDGG